jgi:Fuc2NAc and GlcNAc transferase
LAITWILLPSFVAAFLLTWTLRRHAVATKLLDMPTARSSHSVPTPRGGGLAIVAVVLTALPWLWLQGFLSTGFFLAWLGAGMTVALVGWWDDRDHVSARWRLLVHFAAAGWAIFWLGGLPQLDFFGRGIDFGWFGQLLAVVYLAWLLNLYNFMDGIDGIAGIEAITVGLGAAFLTWLALSGTGLWMAPLLLAAATAGFLVWNFPSARIFMGDAGSGYVGISLGMLSLQAGVLAPELFWAWVILLGAFIVDATFTLLRRLLRGDRVYQAHRMHAYQHAARRVGSHVPISLSVGAINLFWLLPMATLVGLGVLGGAAGILIAYAPLVVLVSWLGAGVD